MNNNKKPFSTKKNYLGMKEASVIYVPNANFVFKNFKKSKINSKNAFVYKPKSCG